LSLTATTYPSRGVGTTVEDEDAISKVNSSGGGGG
jgi:hypothetical protein